jgi:arabinose-5-phosphate isomerase
MTLALDDAIVIACLWAREFEPAQFRVFHPCGKLNQKLMRVKDLIHSREVLPLVSARAEVRLAVVEMSRGRFGYVGICDESGKLTDVLTDGDLRRHIVGLDLSSPLQALMTTKPYHIDADAFIADVSFLFTEKRISSGFVSQCGTPTGLMRVDDLLQGVFI